ncbi:MAG: polysaccharide deacetylase family protein [Motiliproteus sp.]|nr:polysaccharide deacetylase family protein [Motiliproteus sp.]MCW9051952.1 polysaccharide deacetylase family protein [Motiliproteus sp.]
MISPAWQALADELSLWEQQGRTATLWWRDDDACTDSAALRRLNQLSLDYQVPLHLAVIPAHADSSLLSLFQQNSKLSALQHGYSHLNHAPANERKCELGHHRPLQQVLEELSTGREKLEQLIGSEQFNPTLVPPWNRLSDQLTEQLAKRGFIGLSTLKPRPEKRIFGLTQVNVHIDIINWKERQFAGEERALAQLLSHLQDRRRQRVDADEATGLMTHHLDHDELCWVFCERLFQFLKGYPVRWLDQSELFPR